MFCISLVRTGVLLAFFATNSDFICQDVYSCGVAKQCTGRNAGNLELQIRANSGLFHFYVVLLTGGSAEWFAVSFPALRSVRCSVLSPPNSVTLGSGGFALICAGRSKNDHRGNSYF